MKTKLTMTLLGAALLFASASSGWALPPRQHAFRGVIESIDQSAHTFTVAPADGKQSLVFVWKDSTRFKQSGSRVGSGALQIGEPVKIYYRREIGQLVPREVTLSSAAASGCLTATCALKRERRA